MSPALVLVGGFLGSGKTTLILTAAGILRGRGLRSAAILNDQGDDLIDTRVAELAGLDAEQVAGGCFCCRFSDLIDAAGRLEAYAPDVIFAEAVGSCTDIAATVLRPLQREYAGRSRVAPLTVLVDPLRRNSDPETEFLLRHQVAEADLVVTSKADLGANGDRRLSARTGEGVAAWLDEVLSGGLPAGSRRIEIDYEHYAAAEAALAWLNGRARLRLPVPLSPAMVLGPLLERLDEATDAAGIAIAHLKLLDECPSGYVKAAICRNRQEPDVEGVLDASPEPVHDLLINVRAAGDPVTLRAIVSNAVAEACEQSEWLSLGCFRPAAPNPERRA